MASVSTGEAAAPVRDLSWVDAVAVVMGIVIGSGIFITPALVAGNTTGLGTMLAAWLGGGILCFCGALSYAELATAYPHSGGEYVYLSRAYGKAVGFFFVWSRMTVIQTGSIAAAAYIFGRYANRLLPLGPSGPLLYALGAAVVLTGMNAVGLRAGKWTQNLLTVTKVLGIVAIILVGAFVSPSVPPVPVEEAQTTSTPAFGLAMVFVLYTFGGWSEAAYVAGEVRQAQADMVRALVFSMFGLTALYVAINLAYFHILGFEGMRASDAIAADTVAATLGEPGSLAVSVLVAIAALGAVNGCIFTGGRAVWALGGDFRLFKSLARWNPRRNTPSNAILAQGVIVVVLILLPGLGPGFRAALGSGFEAAVEYTAPVFWTFLLLTSVAVFILRVKDRVIQRPFHVPLYPLTVILFSLMCAYMLYSSVAYTGAGALVGLGVLAAGVPFYLFCGSPRVAEREEPKQPSVLGPNTGPHQER